MDDTNVYRMKKFSALGTDAAGTRRDDENFDVERIAK
jgi:hypothetical protein